MTFASPALLWALPLAAIPVLLHLLSRKQAARVPFSDLTLLQRIHARALPKTRLRQWLLVAARCLILFCLVLAYARPVLRASPTEEAAPRMGAEGLDLVLLLDDSYSMGFRERGKTRFELARRDAVELVRGMKASDRVAVGIFSDKLETGPLAWLSLSEALAALERARLGYRTTDYAAALRGAGSLLSGETRRRRVVLVLSDGASHGFRGERPALDPGILWLGLRWPKADNAAIVGAGPAAESSALKPRLSVRARGAAGRAVELMVDGRRAQGAALAGSGREQSAGLSLPSPRDAADPAWFGSASLRPDALSADDSFYFSLRHAARPKVLCLHGNPAFLKAPNDGYFLKQLFGGAKESLLDYDVDFLELGRLGEAKLSDYRVVVVSDFKDVAAPAAMLLERFVRRGGGLWVLPGGRTDPEGFDALGPWLPAQFGALVAGEGPGLKVGTLAETRLWKEFDLGKVALWRYYLLTARAGSTVAFKSKTGYPLLVLGAHGSGRIAVWASSLDVSWSNLAVKPVFAAWVRLILDDLSASSQRRSETLESFVGEPLARVWPPDEPAPSSVRVRAPDGHSTTLWLKDRRLEYPGAEMPGLYTATEEGTDKRRVFAVNLDRRGSESDLEPLEVPPWRILESDSVASDFRLEVYGKDARGAVLATAAAVLLLEMFLALPRSPAVLLLLALLVSPFQARAQQGDRFVWSQVKLGPEWDPYPGVPLEVAENLSTLTSVLSVSERRVVTLKDKALWSSPLIVLTGRQAPPALDDSERRALRDYLLAGGTLWLEDASGAPASSFDRWARQSLPSVLPEAELSPLGPDHVLYKTFFLLRGPAGRVIARDGIEGISWAGRTAVIYSRNDILGAWAKDALGKPLYPCTPGGEAQRTKAKRLTLNIIMYALTGNYKADAVHQPYLLQKMRSGVP
ncbi:MAG: DUF4159 domain-containing protein [Elusimicrobia bacterium]|nr:DUF4159 domain-containing protein [Elusimicrobiota bacterium]